MPAPAFKNFASRIIIRLSASPCSIQPARATVSCLDLVAVLVKSGGLLINWGQDFSIHFHIAIRVALVVSALAFQP
jgi:hypothetical protein